MPDADEPEPAYRHRLPSLPRPVRTAGIGLLAGVTGGVVATAVGPASTLATVALVVAVIVTVTWAWLRVR